MVCKTFSLPEEYVSKLNELKKVLGIKNNSEILRRAIDELAKEYSVEVVSQDFERVK